MKHSNKVRLYTLGLSVAMVLLCHLIVAAVVGADPYFDPVHLKIQGIISIPLVGMGYMTLINVVTIFVNKTD